MVTGDAPTIAAIAIAALGVGAGAMRLGQMALKRNSKHGEVAKSAGLSAAEWKAEIGAIDAKNLDEKVMPILRELKEIAGRQNDIQQKQNEILVELVTVSRIGRRP
jgi:hypothetical protein